MAERIDRLTDIGIMRALRRRDAADRLHHPHQRETKPDQLLRWGLAEPGEMVPAPGAEQRGDNRDDQYRQDRQPEQFHAEGVLADWTIAIGLDGNVCRIHHRTLHDQSEAAKPPRMMANAASMVPAMRLP